MRFLSFRHSGKASFGAVVGAGVVDLGQKFLDLTNLRDAICSDKLPFLSRHASTAPIDYSLDEIEFLPTIPNPEKIICIGVNYANRHAEYQDVSLAPRYPSVFMRSRESLVGHEAPLLDPPESDQLDYEGEIVMVIGKEGRRIPEAAAHEHVVGLTIMNEGCLRDFLRHAKFNVTQGKNFENSGALGPWLVTANELNPFDNLHIMTRVNGEERQNDVTANLVFSFRYLISYLSTFFRLKPGDIIATGTPNGAGARFNPPKFLKSGDVVEVEVPGVGILTNPVVTEAV
ncbi:MAG: fumarylacetoacetate hydrolase family protein [Gammaproteobacteria bacterium]|nr:fumarylacetoacetate hydrolase family protein [Gammaproteobacteria bacterium]